MEEKDGMKENQKEDHGEGESFVSKCLSHLVLFIVEELACTHHESVQIMFASVSFSFE